VAKIHVAGSCFLLLQHFFGQQEEARKLGQYSMKTPTAWPILHHEFKYRSVTNTIALSAKGYTKFGYFKFISCYQSVILILMRMFVQVFTQDW